MTSKSVISSSPQDAILAGNAATKSSSAHGTSVGSNQFDDEFHSALQQHSTTSKADTSKVSPAPASQTKVAKQPAVAADFTRDLQQSNAQTVAAKPGVPDVPVTQVADATNGVLTSAPDVAAKAALLAAIPKDASVVTQTVANNKTLPLDSANESSKDKKTKKSDSDTTADNTDSSSASSIIGLFVAPVPAPTTPTAPISPATASDTPAPAKNSDNSQLRQALPPLSSATPQATTPNTPVAAAPDASSAPVANKETEAFSMLLTPKTAPVAQQNASPAAATQKTNQDDAVPAPKNGLPAANQPVSPTKAALNAAPAMDENTTAPAISARTAATSPATNSTSTTPSSLEPGSGTAARNTRADDKEDAVASTAGANDAAGNKQDFGGFGSTPDTFAKDMKVAGSAAPSAPAATHAPEMQDNAATATGSAKEVAIRLEGQSGQTINVKLTDQGGQVQVSVRSNDPAAATALRGDLSSLASNLDKAGWKPEITAVVAGTSLEAVSQTRQPDRNNQDSQGSRQPDWQQQDTPRKRQSVSDLWDELLTQTT